MAAESTAGSLTSYLSASPQRPFESRSLCLQLSQAPQGIG